MYFFSISGGELFERITSDNFDYTEQGAIHFLRQIVAGLEYMHGKDILHLDMKPENILCTKREGNNIKIIDFGLARRFDPKKELKVVECTCFFYDIHVYFRH